MSYYSQPDIDTPYQVHQIDTENEDIIVDFRYTTAEHNFQWFYENPIEREGYDLIAVVNGGAFLSSNGRPSHTCVVNGTEWSTEPHYGDGIPDLALRNDHLYSKWEFYNADVLDNNEVQRGSYRFAFYKENNILTPIFSSTNQETNNNARLLYELPDKRVGVGFKASGAACFVVINNNVTGEEYRDICAQLGYETVINLDGGGSTSMWVEKTNVDTINPSRNIHEVFYIYKRKNSSIPASDLSILPIQEPVLIRRTPVDGAVLASVSNSNNVKIRYFISRFMADGYQWAAVQYNNIRGYAKLNTFRASRIYGTVSPNVYILTTYHAAYIRSSVVSGNILVTVPKATRFRVINFLGTMSDGYQWAETEYNGIRGYTQIDLYNWHLLTF